MSLYRIVNASKLGSPLLASRAVLTSVASASIFRRSYWWNKKHDEDKEKTKEEKEKTKEEKKEPTNTALGSKPAPAVVKTKGLNDLFNEKQIANDLSKYSESLLRNDNMDAGMNDAVDVSIFPKGARDPYKSFQEFMTPRPVRLHDEMIIPAIPLPIRPLLPGFMQNLTLSDRATIQKLREVQSSPDRYVGLFLRKERSSNDLADNPDIIRSMDEVYNIGTYGFRCSDSS